MSKEKIRNYGAKDIRVLTGLEPVRLRPGMYIGSTGVKGLHHLVYEVVDNSIDEALAGVCDTITVTIFEDNSVRVEDNGSGIPVEVHPQTGKSTLETVLTILHAGGKFNNNAYQVSGGLHGVGVSVVNALSEWLIANVKRDGKLYEQQFSRGNTTSKLEVVGTSKETGTIITFKPDSEIFDTKIIFTDEREDFTETFHYEGGIKSFVEYMNRNKNNLHNEVIYFQGQRGDSQVEISMQYTDGYSENVLTFANNIHTPEGGSHLVGFRTALTRTLNDYGRKYNLIKDKDANLQGDDTREGLTGIVSIKLPNPQFEGQTKAKLGNSESRGIVETFLYDNLMTFLE